MEVSAHVEVQTGAGYKSVVAQWPTRRCGFGLVAKQDPVPPPGPLTTGADHS